MKKLILGILFLFTVSFAFAGNELNNTFVEIENMEINNAPLKIDKSSIMSFKVVHNEMNIVSCTYSIKVYVLTEAGIIGAGFSITADTCEEAWDGIWSAAKGFIDAMK